MTPKDAVKEKLKELPNDFQGLLATAIMPTLAEVPAPADEAEAVMAQGHLAKYLLVAFDRLGGLPILEVPLRIGQFVPAQHILAVSALEFVGSQAGGDIQMIMPTPGGSYYGAVTEVRCKVLNVSSVTVSADGDTFELSQESGGEWAGLWAFPIGSHSITVTAGDKSLKVHFAVQMWATYPEQGETIQEQITAPVQVKLVAGEQYEAISDVSFTFAQAIGYNFELQRDTQTNDFIIDIDPVIFFQFQDGLFDIRLSDGSTLHKAVSWLVQRM